MSDFITNIEAIELLEATMKIRDYIDKIHDLSYKAEDPSTPTLVLLYLAEIEEKAAAVRKMIEEGK